MEEKTAPQGTPPSAPVMDVRTPPPSEDRPADKKQPSPATDTSKPPPPKPKIKKNKDNVTAAIAATVIIVLGLAVLATYAFLKTHN